MWFEVLKRHASDILRPVLFAFLPSNGQLIEILESESRVRLRSPIFIESSQLWLINAGTSQPQLTNLQLVDLPAIDPGEQVKIQVDPDPDLIP